MRSPSLNIESRMPTINPTWRRGSIRTSPASRRRPTTPIARRASASGSSDASECALFAESVSGLQLRLSRQRAANARIRPVASADGGGGGSVRQRARTPAARAATRRRRALNLRAIANEIVAEIDGSLSDAQADELARRHGLARLQSQNFPLIGATIGLFRITDRRSVETVQPRIRRRRQRSLGAAELPLCCCRSRRPRRPRAIPRNMRWQSFGCRRRIRWPTAPMSPSP